MLLLFPLTSEAAAPKETGQLPYLHTACTYNQTTVKFKCTYYDMNQVNMCMPTHVHGTSAGLGSDGTDAVIK